MIILKSHRSIIYFWFPVIFVTLFFLGIATALLFISFETLQKENVARKEYLLPFVCLPLFIFALALPYTYFKNTPSVSVYNDYIKIGKKKYLIEDISGVTLSGKMPFNFLLTSYLEGFEIRFNYKTSIVLYDNFYSNIAEIKFFLENIVLKKQEATVLPQFYSQSNLQIVESEKGNVELPQITPKTQTVFQCEKTFKDNQFTSFQGILLWSSLMFSIIFPLIKNNLGIGIFLLTVFWIPIFFLQSRLMNYFVLDDDFLTVKNHNRFWIKKRFPLSDIREVVFETPDRQPNSLRIISNNFKTKIFRAGTLRDKTWISLKTELELRGIPVRNESIYDGEKLA